MIKKPMSLLFKKERAIILAAPTLYDALKDILAVLRDAKIESVNEAELIISRIEVIAQYARDVVELEIEREKD